MLKYFMMGVRLIVVGVGEGLGMSVRLSVGLKMGGMVKRKNVVGKMDGWERMGGIRVICRDKRGRVREKVMEVYDGELDECEKKVIGEGIGRKCRGLVEEKEGEGKGWGVGKGREVGVLVWVNEEGMD